MTKRPPQVTCRCPIWPFPHRATWECANLESEQEIAGDWRDEYADERWLDERERAKYVNALNRNAAK